MQDNEARASGKSTGGREYSGTGTALKIVAYIVGLLVLGCVIAPPLYWGGTALGRLIGNEFLVETPFQRYFNRAILIAAILLLYPMFRWLGIKSFADFGLRKNPYRWQDALAGFAVAFVVVFGMGLVAVAFDVYKPERNFDPSKFFKVIPTMLAVSFLEEGFFRGAILGMLLVRWRTLPALWFVSAIFSIVHFLKPPDYAVEVDPVTMLSGFQLLPHAFHQFQEPLLVLGGFLTLLGIGLLLGYTRIWTNSLWMAIGIHAGLIAGQRCFNIVFRQRKTYPEEWLELWFGPRIEIGLAPLVGIVVIGAGVMLFLNWHRLKSFRKNGQLLTATPLVPERIGVRANQRRL